MLAHLPPETPYLGIDVQSRAIDVARQSCRGDHQRVHCADLSSIVLAESFGCILFSEVLYYQPTVTAAMHLLARYVPFVKKDGIVLVSIFIDPNKPERINGPIWQAIHYEYGSQLIASDAVPTRDDQSHWRIVALKF